MNTTRRLTALEQLAHETDGTRGRCTDCPWCLCIKELPAAERGEFTAALRVVRRSLAPADGAPSAGGIPRA